MALSGSFQEVPFAALLHHLHGLRATGALQLQSGKKKKVLQLEQGVEYTLHLSSVDVNHGFNLYPFNVNFQVVPGYDYGLRVTPTEAGDYRIVCNEFCGVNHHIMVGRVIVVDGASSTAAAPDQAEETGGDR